MTCARAEMVEIGLYWFEAMVTDYRMTPLVVIMDLLLAY